MSLLIVLHFPDTNLRKKAAPIEVIDESIAILAEDMLETMYSEMGIGLAAVQANVLKRIIVMDLSVDRNEPRVMINPEIISREGKQEAQESCLSVPGFSETVERTETICFKYLNLEEEMIEDKVGGLLAVCIQHETDHLDGKLFIDYLSPLKRQVIQKKIKKQDKQQYQLL